MKRKEKKKKRLKTEILNQARQNIKLNFAFFNKELFSLQEKYAERKQITWEKKNKNDVKVDLITFLLYCQTFFKLIFKN